MILNAAQLCELLHGELIGDGGREIHGPSQIDKGEAGTVSFLANPKYENHVYTTGASVLIVSKDFTPDQPVKATLIRVQDVYSAMMTLIEKFSKNGVPKPGISPFAVIDPTIEFPEEISIGAYTVIETNTKLGARTILYPQVFIGHDSVIGEDVIIYPGAKLYPNTRIGNRCIIHANAVIGSDGFGYRPDDLGHYHKINHVGSVIIEDDVEVGANTVIDRGTLAATQIGKGSKIDNLVQIAHNVQVGNHTVIAAQTGIAGSSKIGNHVQIGGQVGIKGHVELADKIVVQAQSGIHTGKYPVGSKLYGSPAIIFNDYLKSYSIFRKLPDLVKKIEDLEKKMDAANKGEL